MQDVHARAPARAGFQRRCCLVHRRIVLVQPPPFTAPPPAHGVQQSLYLIPVDVDVSDLLILSKCAAAYLHTVLRCPVLRCPVLRCGMLC
jgi:hypothetical protein